MSPVTAVCYEGPICKVHCAGSNGTDGSTGDGCSEAYILIYKRKLREN